MRIAALILAGLLSIGIDQSPQTSAASLVARGDAERQAGKYAEAIRTYDEARAEAERSGDRVSVAASWHGQAAAYTARSEYRRALECFEQAVTLREQIGDGAALATSLSGMGIVHRQQGRFGDAIGLYTRALDLLGQSDRLQRARTLNNLGVAYVAQGDYDLALKYYDEALVLHDALENRAGYAGTLMNIGIVHRQRGDNASALDAYERGLALVRQLGDRPLIAEALKSIGVLHASQGNAAVAMDYYRQARELYTALGTRTQIALVERNIGVLHQRARDPALARASFLEALRIRESIDDRVGIAESRHDLGSLARDRGDVDTADREYGAALAIAEALGDRRAVTLSLQGLQQVAMRRGRYETAVSIGQRALGLAQQLGDRERVWQTLTVTGRAQVALGLTADARASFTEAIATIESLRHDVAGGDADRQRAFERKVSPYYELVKLSMAERAFPDALAMAERAKARVVLDILQSARVSITTAMTDPERAEERAIVNGLAALTARIAIERRRTPADAALVADLDRQLARARSAREAFETRLFSAHPELRRQRSETPPAGLDAIASALPDDGSAALQYVVTDSDAWVFVLTRSSGQPRLDVHRLSSAPGDLARLVEQLADELARRDLNFRSTASRAYDVLLGPVAPQLAKASTLVIVPDGALWRVPFQALWNRRQGRYVVERHAVAYAPSLSVLVELRRASSRARDGADSLLAFGNPSLGSSPSGGSGLRVDPIAPLPLAATEVRSLGALYGAPSRVYVGREAREDRLKSEASRFSVLHLATHGVLDDASPMYSQVLLAPTPDGGGDDGQLQAWELARLPLAARLVVLSGCETARGRVAAGEGVIGLTWSIFVAGASAAVVSQWSVDSASTSDLMLAFHRHLLGRATAGRAMPAARALQQAAIRSLRSPQYRHPFYWAAFVVVGDGL